jgi:hypothetical protein
MPTAQRKARIPRELEDAARARHPELADESVSVLIRAGLALLAGIAINEVIGQLRGKGRTSRVPVPAADPRAKQLPELDDAFAKAMQSDS